MPNAKKPAVMLCWKIISDFSVLLAAWHAENNQQTRRGRVPQCPPLPSGRASEMCFLEQSLQPRSPPARRIRPESLGLPQIFGTMRKRLRVSLHASRRRSERSASLPAPTHVFSRDPQTSFPQPHKLLTWPPPPSLPRRSSTSLSSPRICSPVASRVLSIPVSVCAPESVKGLAPLFSVLRVFSAP